MGDEYPDYRWTGLVVCSLTLFPVCAVWLAAILSAAAYTIGHRIKHGEWPPSPPCDGDFTL